MTAPHQPGDARSGSLGSPEGAASDPSGARTTAVTEPAQPVAVGPERRRITAEIWIVLGLSLGQSAVYSIISLSAKLTAGRPLA